MKFIVLLFVFASLASFAGSKQSINSRVIRGVTDERFPGGLITDEEARKKREGGVERVFLDCFPDTFFGEQCGDACRRAGGILPEAGSRLVCEELVKEGLSCYCTGKGIKKPKFGAE
jgi:hypothetical protein